MLGITKGNLNAMKVTRLPVVFRLGCVTFLQFIQNVLPTVTPARGADFAKRIFHHALKVGPRSSELWTMEDRLSLLEFIQNIQESWTVTRFVSIFTGAFQVEF